MCRLARREAVTPVAHRLLLPVGHPHWRKFPSSVQSRQLQGVVAVRLDPVAGFLCDQRWCHPLADMAHLCELSVDVVATWPGLLAERQHFTMRTQLLRQFPERLRRVGNFPVELRCLPSRVRHGDSDGFLVCVQPDVPGLVMHGLSP